MADGKKEKEEGNDGAEGAVLTEEGKKEGDEVISPPAEENAAASPKSTEGGCRQCW
jgi:hypothetical protein